MDLALGSGWVLGKFRKEQKEYLIGLRTVKENQWSLLVNLVQESRVQPRNQKADQTHWRSCRGQRPWALSSAWTDLWYGGLSHFLALVPPAQPGAEEAAGPNTGKSVCSSHGGWRNSDSFSSLHWPFDGPCSGGPLKAFPMGGQTNNGHPGGKICSLNNHDDWEDPRRDWFSKPYTLGQISAQ